MRDMRVREWARRQFFDPEPVLKALRGVELMLATTNTPDLIRRLRTGPLKTEREARDALLFAHGMAQVTGSKVWVSPGESGDCDFVTKTTVGGTEHFTCVQLKELVPEDRNPSADLPTLLGGVSRYAKSESVLAVRLNRRGKLDFSELAKTRVPFSELWYFWAGSADSTQWCLFGNAMKKPSLYQFTYPSQT